MGIRAGRSEADWNMDWTRRGDSDGRGGKGASEDLVQPNGSPHFTVNSDSALCCVVRELERRGLEVVALHYMVPTVS